MTNGNDSAFARPAMRDELGHQWHDDILSHDGESGLTKREYFAAMIYAAHRANPQPYDDSADYAVRCADALIEALNKDH